MSSSVWSGHLVFGLLSIPARLYPGARERRIELHLIHQEDKTQLKMPLWCPRDEKLIPRKEVALGFSIGDGPSDHLALDPGELKAIEPATSRRLQLAEFVPAAEVDPLWFRDGYRLQPEKGAERPLAVIAQALREQQACSIARLHMHRRDHAVCVRESDGGLALHTLYLYEELRPAAQLEEAPAAAEVREAGRYIAALVASFRPMQLRSEYQEALAALIQKKLGGQKKPMASAPGKELEAALRQSAKEAKRTRKAKGVGA